MYKRFLRAVLVGILSMCLSLPVFAGTPCTGKLIALIANPTGGIVMSLSGPGVSLNMQVLCSLTTLYNGIEPAACKAIYALLLTARTLDRNVTFWFDVAAPTVQCNNTRFPDWSLMSTTAPTGGWYFGPNLE
jgi:hypothetical protein